MEESDYNTMKKRLKRFLFQKNYFERKRLKDLFHRAMELWFQTNAERIRSKFGEMAVIDTRFALGLDLPKECDTINNDTQDK